MSSNPDVADSVHIACPVGPGAQNFPRGEPYIFHFYHLPTPSPATPVRPIFPPVTGGAKPRTHHRDFLECITQKALSSKCVHFKVL